jgi:hypothetical protein
MPLINKFFSSSKNTPLKNQIPKYDLKPPVPIMFLFVCVYIGVPYFIVSTSTVLLIIVINNGNSSGH